MSMQLSSILSLNENLHDDTDDSRQETHTTLGKMQSRCANALSPEQLSKHLRIGLSTAKRTIEATTHECIRSTGTLTKLFKIDRSQLRSAHEGLWKLLL